MWVTEFGMVNSTKELQPQKASFPMYVTESGMVNLAKVSQSSKAEIINPGFIVGNFDH